MLVTLGIAAGLSSDTAAPIGAQFFCVFFFQHSIIHFQVNVFQNETRLKLATSGRRSRW